MLLHLISIKTKYLYIEFLKKFDMNRNDKKSTRIFHNKKGQEADDETMPVAKIIAILLAVIAAVVLYFVIKRVHDGFLPK